MLSPQEQLFDFFSGVIFGGISQGVPFERVAQDLRSGLEEAIASMSTDEGKKLLLEKLRTEVGCMSSEQSMALETLSPEGMEFFREVLDDHD